MADEKVKIEITGSVTNEKGEVPKGVHIMDKSQALFIQDAGAGRILEDKAEVGGQKSEDGDQKTEDGDQKSEVGGRKSEAIPDKSWRNDDIRDWLLKKNVEVPSTVKNKDDLLKLVKGVEI